ncbi:hypothetical protein MAJ_10579, partial [Metarhizium majus ARSEF 297]
MKSGNEEDYDVLIIGGGMYGLIAAYTYLKLAPETNLLILDDGQSIGGVWSIERIYPDLFAQVGHGLFEYSFYPMKKMGLSPDRYISAQTIHNYLQSFAEDHDLVRRIRAKLIVATGVTSGPHVPDFPQKGFHKPILHSSELGKYISHLIGPKAQPVTVLGAAKSAYDTAFMLIKSGKQLDWIIRENGSGPLAIMPPRLMGFLNTVDLMATRAVASFSPAIMNTSGAWYNFLQKTRIGNTLTWAFWRLLSWMAKRDAGYHKDDNWEKLRPIPKDYGIFWANSGLGLASAPDFWKTIHSSGLTVHRTEIDGFSDGSKVVLRNEQVLEADAVILCTGWTDNLGLFDESTRVTYGLPSAADLDQGWQDLDALADMEVLEKLPLLKYSPNTINAASTIKPWRLYRRMISPIMSAKGDRSVFFPGQIHSVFTPLVAEVQALWGVAFMLGRLHLPNQEDMMKEVSMSCAWTRRRYLEQGRKHAYYMYDFLSYIDALATDLGLNTNRKANAISEMFTPYRPSDWRGLISEYLAVEKKLQVNGSGKHINGVRY